MSRKQFFAPKHKRGSNCSRSTFAAATPSAFTRRAAAPTNSEGLLKFVLKSRQELFLIPSSVTEEIEDGVRVVLALNEHGAATVVPWENVDYITEISC